MDVVVTVASCSGDNDAKPTTHREQQPHPEKELCDNKPSNTQPENDTDNDVDIEVHHRRLVAAAVLLLLQWTKEPLSFAVNLAGITSAHRASVY